MIQALDQIRSHILRTTLRLEVLQYFYRDRVRRTLFLMSLGLVVNAALIWYRPDWAFYFIPLFLGIPHLFASYRFSIAAVSTKRFYSSIYMVWIAVFVAHLLIARGYWEDAYSFTEMGALILTAVIGLRAVGGQGYIRGLMLPLGLTALYLWNPFIVASAMLLLHNLVAYWFWYRSSESGEEKKSVGVGLVLLVLICAALVWAISIRAVALHGVNEISETLFGLHSFPFSSAVVIFFLLSQSAHYFIWLKAIPDYQNPAQTPGNFQNTMDHLKREFGLTPLAFGGGLALLLIAWTIFLGSESGRVLYVQLSAYHGFAELAMVSVFISRGRG